jgi:hypothetical protein
MRYNIYQIKLSEAIYDFVNGPEGGHSETAKKFPEYNTHMEVMHKGSKGYKPEMFAHYTTVCKVADFVTESNKLEEVFKVLNGYYFDEDAGTDLVFEEFVSGFKMRTFLNKKTKEVREVRDMHSLSVGDIIEDTETGKFHMVDGFGFSELTLEKELVA